ncbi:hypothetical protein KEM54_003698 [Ascosphaera aggregata]|nr:hypothetical protein KEM54_003698 [Ascosphaera aggregata]
MGLIPFTQEADACTIPYACKADDTAAINAQWAGRRFPVSEEDSSQVDISPTTESAPDSFRSPTTSLFDTPLTSQAPSLRGDADRCFDPSDTIRHSQQQQRSKQELTELSYDRASPTIYLMSTAVATLYTLQKNKHGILTVSRSYNAQTSFSSAEVFKIDSDNIQREQWAKHIRITDVVPRAPSNSQTSLSTTVLRDGQGLNKEQTPHTTGRDCFRVARRRGCRQYDIYHRELSGYLPTSSELATKCRSFSYDIDIPHLRVTVSPAAIVVRKSLNTSNSPVLGISTYCTNPLVMFDLKELTLSVNIDGIRSTFFTPCATDALVVCVLIIATVDPDTKGVLSRMPHPECHCDIAPAAALPHVVVPPGCCDSPITSVYRALSNLRLSQQNMQRNKQLMDEGMMSMDPPIGTSPSLPSCREDHEPAEATVQRSLSYSLENQPINFPASISHRSDTETGSTMQSVSKSTRTLQDEHFIHFRLAQAGTQAEV